jgi:TfoX/Sxy family transcriptional regulator of competence genes
MPYWAIPDTVLADDTALVEWASGALEIAAAAK